MGGHRQRAQYRAPELAATIAAAIEASLEARLRAEGRDPLPRGQGARARHRRLLDVAEAAVERLEDGPSCR
jgi:hypothetical protein